MREGDAAYRTVDPGDKRTTKTVGEAKGELPLAVCKAIHPLPPAPTPSPDEAL
jgi:hypothetical protein